jgi:hypothetical protein
MRAARRWIPPTIVARRSAPAAWMIAAVLCVAQASAAGSDFEVRYDRARLSVRIHRVPLEDVLAAVSRETGITIEGQPLDRRDVSKRFDRLPLGQALKRIVGRQNFVLSYAADGRPQRLVLLGAPLSPPAVKPPVQQRGVNALRALLAHPPIAVPPRAAKALGGNRLPVVRVLTGLRNDDPLVRNECASAIVAAIEAHAPTLAAMQQLEAQQLVDFITGQAGPHAADAAARFYRAARDPRLKSKLSTVLAAVRRAVG